jgi:aspartyl protease family protein
VSRFCLISIAALVFVCSLHAAAGTDVQVVAVSPGMSADVVIGGGAPITIGVGETIEGVTLVSADRRGAVLRIGGVAKSVPLSAYRASGGGGEESSFTLVADPSGHFFANGEIDGTRVRFMVDTGATAVVLSRAQAEQIGIDYESGTPSQSVAVNGVVAGWRVSLDSVRVGNTTERDVVAVVVETNSLPVALLGMTYLNRFDMQRQGKTLVLRRR